MAKLYEVQNGDQMSLPMMKSIEREIQDRLDLKYVYVRADDDDSQVDETLPRLPSKYGGLTIAYVVSLYNLPSNIVWVSLAWCNPNEQFNKTIGKYFAATRYEQNMRVPLRLAETDDIALQLQELFYGLV